MGSSSRTITPSMSSNHDRVSRIDMGRSVRGHPPGAAPFRPLCAISGPEGPRSGHNASMPTDLLYLRDAELRTFDATVVSASDDGVVLDRTAFYVTGGGQPHDNGTLTWDGGEAQVVDVRKAGGEVVHVLDGPTPPVGA